MLIFNLIGNNHLHCGRTKNGDFRYFDPFPIIKIFGLVAYKMLLLLIIEIHPMFYY